MFNIRPYEPLWGEWYAESLYNQGTFGKVYKVRRGESDNPDYATVKIIPVPHGESEIEKMTSAGYDNAEIRKYFHYLMQKVLQHAHRINDLSDTSHIVLFEDIGIIERSDSIGWDILLRIEELTSLSAYMADKTLPLTEIVKLGIHICRALEQYAESDIIHRNVRPNSIFLSANGDYKLGNLNIAQQIDPSDTSAKKGIYSYIAPEIYLGKQYDASVDTYALGILLYCCLNHNRIPFLPEFPQPISPNHYGEALQMRMNGEDIPHLKRVSRSLSDLVLKACAYKCGDRFASPAEMRKALEAIARIKTSAFSEATALAPITRQEAPQLPSFCRYNPLLTAAVPDLSALAAGHSLALPAAEPDIEATAVIPWNPLTVTSDQNENDYPAVLPVLMAAEPEGYTTRTDFTEDESADFAATQLSLTEDDPDAYAIQDALTEPVLADLYVLDPEADNNTFGSNDAFDNDTFDEDESGLAAENQTDDDHTQSFLPLKSKFAKPLIAAASIICVSILTGTTVYGISSLNKQNDSAFQTQQQELPKIEPQTTEVSNTPETTDPQQEETATPEQQPAKTPPKKTPTPSKTPTPPTPSTPDPQDPDPQDPDPQDPDPQDPAPQDPDPQNPDPQDPNPPNPSPNPPSPSPPSPSPKDPSDATNP